MDQEAYDIPLDGPMVIQVRCDGELRERLSSDLFIIDHPGVPESQHGIAFVESGWHHGGTLSRLMQGDVVRLAAEWWAIGDRYAVRTMSDDDKEDFLRAWPEMKTEKEAGRGTREQAAEFVQGAFDLPGIPK